MTKERKEQIIDDYIKDIKLFLNVGLCEGQANGSFGEDLMRHFDIIAECFKETTLLEHDLGIDLITIAKALEILIKKDVSFDTIKACKTYEDYRAYIKNISSGYMEDKDEYYDYFARNLLQKDEFYLLKKVRDDYNKRQGEMILKGLGK